MTAKNSFISYNPFLIRISYWPSGKSLILHAGIRNMSSVCAERDMFYDRIYDSVCAISFRFFFPLMAYLLS
jgi:hypothetical protein